jgi:hypothetical protein
MASEYIGYRRLYGSRGCALAGRESYELTFPAGETRVELYLGPKPHLGVMVQSGDKYFVYGEQSVLTQARYDKDAINVPEAGRFFTEIRCSLPIDVADDLSARFRNKDSAAQAALLTEAEKHRPRFAQVADLVAGIVGLRFHRQLVLELRDENPYVERGPGDTPANFASSAVEMLDGITIREEGIAAMGALLNAVGQAPAEALEPAATIMRWLVLAWEERNSVAKFLSLFIPLECVLAGVGGNPAKEKARAERFAKLSSLVDLHGGAGKAELAELVRTLARNARPSLNERFEQLARAAQLPSCEADIVAFRRFNDIRNKLLHEGRKDVRLVLGSKGSASDPEQGLEDLVERYVSWALFQDTSVYPSHWRHGPGRLKW